MIVEFSIRHAVGIVCDRKWSRSPKQLWQSLPPVSRKCAICYTYFLASLRTGFTQQTTSTSEQR